ncbi:protein adenylyltransferase SelO [Crocinitomix algicola]|uniref:protein adenylyltransferase SelO n=1 Tax=Crocinitomix algicola TaxID=1740263 RepID=UPI00083334EF|nr:YdiU family protein [Crocinitomix algicola]
MFYQKFTEALPADKNEKNTPRQVTDAAYSYVSPQKFENASLIHVNHTLLNELKLNDIEKDELALIFTGQKTLNNQKPYAMCYAGHQFGNWAGQLGDGRAINIAELDMNKHPIVLQLKGAGKTPYSRSADGLAVLRSSIREFLMSEAMFSLGIPTTRALSIALSGDQVLRDILYNGNPAHEKGAIVCRTAPSFIRFGNFENFAARGNKVLLKKLTDYTIQTFYSHLGAPSKSTYLVFFKEVAMKSLEMVMDWQRVGFVHGVMNTDNMSILGLTIDYGPFGWLENYDPAWTPNTTDAQFKRYRYGNQPHIVLWNLTQLANALYPLIEEAAPLEHILEEYQETFQKRYLQMMLQKLGIDNQQPDDDNFINLLTDLLRISQMDMTLFFRKLSKFDPITLKEHLPIIEEDSYLNQSQFNPHIYKWENWLQQYAARLLSCKESKSNRQIRMNRVNPKYVLRNYMAHLAIQDAEKGDYKLFLELYNLLKKPYDEQPENEKWFRKRPDWAINKVGSSMLSCSS